MVRCEPQSRLIGKKVANPHIHSLYFLDSATSGTTNGPVAASPQRYHFWFAHVLPHGDFLSLAPNACPTFFDLNLFQTPLPCQDADRV